MEYLILNEESIPYTTRANANAELPIFISIVSDALSKNIKSIRISEKLGGSWYEMPVCNNYTLREWLNDKDDDKEFERKIKTFISKTDIPHIPINDTEQKRRYDNSYFFLLQHPQIEVPSLGATYFTSQLAISFSSSEYWNDNIVSILKNELVEEDFVDEVVSVANIVSENQWNIQFEQIENQRKESIRKGRELWEHRENEFPNLIFCGDTEKNFNKMSISEIVFNQLWNTLSLLNNYSSDKSNDFSITSIQATTNLDISDESESVKTNPKLSIYRMFKTQIGKKFFGYHVKNFAGEKRLQFFVEKDSKEIYVGYFGKHLPTKKY